MYELRYSELVRLPTIQERYEYLRLSQRVSDTTFGCDRYANQQFYRSREWKQLRSKIIVRDDGCDLAVAGYSAGWKPTIHHINPVTIEQLADGDPAVFDPENLILCSHETHNAIHFGNFQNVSRLPLERKPNDTIPWR